MEKVNIAEILKDCPKGMELDCLMFDNLVFSEIDSEAKDYPIVTQLPNGVHKWFTSDGRYEANPNAKCVIFPKGTTTWEGFVSPCKFKDGDVISNSLCTCIFKREDRIKGTFDCYCDYCGVRVDDFRVNDDKSKPGWHYGNILDYRLATEEEKQRLFQAIKENGYAWNSEMKTLEMLVLPKFKIGDCIRLLTRDNGVLYTVTRMTDTNYIVICDGKHVYEYTLPISKQDNYEKVCLKFDNKTLVPFESKVLIRNDKMQKWIPSFWGYKTDNGYVTTFGWCRYCIPYEDNEHLLSTSDDCDDKYKTW